MIYIVHNLGPILAALIAGLAFGVAWYALLDRRRRPTVALFATAAITKAWLAAILAGALILAPTQAGAWTMALGSAVVIWAGFVLPTLTLAHRVRDLSWRHTAIDAGHWLGVMLTQAAVMHAVGVVAPGR